MAGKIRIAYLIDTISSDKAGTEKQLLNIIERLDRESFAATIVCLYASPWMAKNRLPCPVVTLGYGGFLKPGFPGVLRRYLRVLKEGRFHLVQTFFEDSVFVGWLGRRLAGDHRLIISRRDLGLGKDEPSYHRLYRRALAPVLRSADGISTNAAAIKVHVSQRYAVAPEKIRVIGNGLELPVSPQTLPPLFREYPARLWVGIVANLKPVKRIDLFLRAVSSLNDRMGGEGARGVVLGDGHLKPELVRLATELGIGDRVHFMGATDNVNDYLHGIHIGVLCSDSEGLSNAIMEYMACGLPVVATNVGGNGELVDDTNGICVPPDDPAKLADALALLASSRRLRKESGERSVEKVKERFTWDSIIPQWETYYRSLAG